MNNASPGSEFYGALHSAHLAQLFITKRRGEVYPWEMGASPVKRATTNPTGKGSVVIFMLSVTVHDFPG